MNMGVLSVVYGALAVVSAIVFGAYLFWGKQKNRLFVPLLQSAGGTDRRGIAGKLTVYRINAQMANSPFVHFYMVFRMLGGLHDAFVVFYHAVKTESYAYDERQSQNARADPDQYIQLQPGCQH